MPTPAGVTRVDVRSALAMRGALWQALKPDLSGADALIMTAAVADYRPAETHASSSARRREHRPRAGAHQDLLAEIGCPQSRAPGAGGLCAGDRNRGTPSQRRPRQAREERIDLVVANHPDSSIGREQISGSLVGVRDAEAFGPLAKHEAADRILEFVVRRLELLDRKP